jgi:hypothetical protein
VHGRAECDDVDLLGAVAKLGQVDPGCNLTLQVRSCSLLEPLHVLKSVLLVETTPR